ncbi:MAG: histidine kinase [Rubrivivax sp.]|nr:histidine kinase [Rubrivivax sp.]
MTAPASSAALWHARWQTFSARALRAFHAYANWLLSISWRRFIVLSVLLLIVVGILHDLPPFTWTVTEHFEGRPARTERAPRPAAPVAPPAPPALPAEPGAGKAKPNISIGKDGIRIEEGKADEGLDISIGKDGIRITPKASASAKAASAAGEAAEEARRAADLAASAADQAIRITVPPGLLNRQEVKEALEEARREVESAMRDAKEAAEEARRDAAEAMRDAQAAQREAEAAMRQMERAEERQTRASRRVTRFGIGDFLMQFTVFWIIASAIIKFTYKGQKQAEVKAAQATETAEAESLKRQVVEARMAAMQAQVEPHFLFNTLASIDHLIETDPARASVMQKNLIALLRASMPTMREAAGGNGSGVRDLGREIAVIRPYLEILKVRMEERLTTDIAVPDGLLSAEFPPMMIQTLVENAIKHGLEPKPEGGHLRVTAEIVHGKLQMTVADTGLGFGKAATAGTGVGLANIRERLQMLYGAKASLTVAENTPSGTVVTVTVPYKTVEGSAA